MAESNGQTRKWSEFLKIKEIFIFVAAVVTSLWVAVNWVDSRYAKNSYVVEAQAEVKKDIIELECRLTTILLGLSTTDLLETKNKYLDKKLRQYVSLQAKQVTTGITQDEQIVLFKLESEISRIQGLLTVLEQENDRPSEEC